MMMTGNINIAATSIGSSNRCLTSSERSSIAASLSTVPGCPYARWEYQRPLMRSRKTTVLRPSASTSSK